MSSRRRRKKKNTGGGSDAFEINVTPMIDMFSVLNTFLLMTAVFSATGQVQVQIPFFSSAPPPTEKQIEKTKSRTIDIKFTNDEITLTVGWSDSSLKSEEFTLKTDPTGLDELQERIYKARMEDPKLDKATLHVLDDTTYQTTYAVLDSIKVLKKSRQPLVWPEDYKLPPGEMKETLIPKIVFGDVVTQ